MPDHAGRPAPREWKVREYAELERVTPRTVKRWIEKGAIRVRRTPGGGVRIIDPPVPPRDRR